MTKKTKIILGVVVVLLMALVAASKMGLLGKKGNFKQVDMEEVATVDIIETVSATGKIYPEVEVSISSEVSGEILDLPFKEGQQVKKGDLLVRVNPDLMQSMVNRTQATYQNFRAAQEQAEAA